MAGYLEQCCKHANLPNCWQMLPQQSRFLRDAVIIYRLKIGHSRLTHSYLLSGEDQPICTKYDTVWTVKDILLDCPELRDAQLKYFTASCLKDIFESVDNQNIIGFIKDDHFYH